MVMELLMFMLTSLLAYLLYVNKRTHWKFDEAGIKYMPGIPFFGNTLKSSFLMRHRVEDIDEVYRAFPDEKYVAYFESMTPVLIIRDPELIKKLTINDHDHFEDHKHFFTPDFVPLLDDCLIMMKGERWRGMRTTLSPAFTSSKMRYMLPFMIEVSRNIVKHLKVHQGEDVDIEDLMRRYSNDVIASTAFGLQVNSVKDLDNEFFRTGQTMFRFSPLQRFYLFIVAISPSFAKLLNLKLFPESLKNLFHNIISTTMKHRIENNIERPDMIQLLMEASKGALRDTNVKSKEPDHIAIIGDTFKPKATAKQWTPDELAGQLFVFFVAGFESTASTLVLLIHELAVNPDIQEKLYQEVISYTKQHGELTFDGLSKLKYMDCFMNEGLRKWALAMVLDRECTKAYELPPPRKGGKPYVVQPGEFVYNLVNSLHMDPKYFPNPEVFDPERFSEENKHKIQPFTFMPFGVGPRNCIGSRFAIMEMKVLLFNLVLQFKLQKCGKTSDPIRLKPESFSIKAVGGTWIQLEERN